MGLTLLDRAVHPLDLAVPRENSPPDCFLILGTPGVVRLGEPMLDAVGLADHVEPHLPGRGRVPVTRLLCELNTVVREDRMDAVGDSLEQMLQELPSCLAVCFIYKLGNRELTRPVDALDEK